MALTPSLDTLEALFRKLQREFYRAHHHRNAIHKADHFYNFCITAHSLRDYLLERLNKTSFADRQAFEDRWSQVPVLVSVSEIANTAKHFQLRKRSGDPKSPRTRKVVRAHTTMYDVYLNEHKEVQVVPRLKVPTLNIWNLDGSGFDLYTFMDEVEKYWKAELKSHGITIRKQPERVLQGAAT